MTDVAGVARTDPARFTDPIAGIWARQRHQVDPTVLRHARSVLTYLPTLVAARQPTQGGFTTKELIATLQRGQRAWRPGGAALSSGE